MHGMSYGGWSGAVLNNKNNNNNNNDKNNNNKNNGNELFTRL